MTRLAQTIAALSALASACSTSTGDGGSGDPPTADVIPMDPTMPGISAPGASEPIPDAVLMDMVGTYAVKRETVQVQDAPVVGKIEVTNRSWSLGAIVRRGDELELSEEGCRAVTEGAVSVTIPDAVPQTTEPEVATLTLMQQGEQLMWSRPEVVTLVGVELDDRQRDALPTAPDDPRVTDPDADGHPGVTVSVSAFNGFLKGDLRIVQRRRTAYVMGERLADGTMRAQVEDLTEQRVLDATNATLKQDVPAETHPDPSRHVVELRKVEGAWDCARMIDEGPRLFEMR